MAPTNRGVAGAGCGDGAGTTDIAISAAVVVSTLREESERLQCLAAAQMAIRESCAERLQTCPELRDDVRIADARKGAYEAAALRLQGIVEAVLRRGGAGAGAEGAKPAKPAVPPHPLVIAALSPVQNPRRRYDALVQLAFTKENVPVDGETMTALRQAHRDVCGKLADASGVAAVELLRGMPELDAWVLAVTGGLPSLAAAATQRLLAAIDSKAWPQSQQAIVEAAVTEIRRLGSDAAVRVMLGL